MQKLRTYSSGLLLILFCCYLSGISMFTHTHILNGSSIVHSHLGGNSEHDHSEAQFAVIDLLSCFQSETAVNYSGVNTPFFYSSEICTLYQAPSKPCLMHDSQTLRGPPQI